MTTRRFRLEPVIPMEDELAETVAAFLHKCVLPPAMANIFPAGHIKLTHAQAAKLTRLGLRPGWPDYLVVHGRIHGIELKRPKGRLSATRVIRTRRGALRTLLGQAEVFPQLEAAGMPIAVCSTLEDVIVALRGWGIPLRIATHG